MSGRTPEQGHQAHCLARAMIGAIENCRDSLIDQAARMLRCGTLPSDAAAWSVVQHEFRLWVQDNGPLARADGYLADGTCTCICADDAEDGGRGND